MYSARRFRIFMKVASDKRMHDRCITGVPFEGNSSRNTLIVNEEYVWVENPFSALENCLSIPHFLFVYQHIARFPQLSFDKTGRSAPSETSKNLPKGKRFYRMFYTKV